MTSFTPPVSDGDESRISVLNPCWSAKARYISRRSPGQIFGFTGFLQRALVSVETLDHRAQFGMTLGQLRVADLIDQNIRLGQPPFCLLKGSLCLLEALLEARVHHWPVNPANAARAAGLTGPRPFTSSTPSGSRAASKLATATSTWSSSGSP